MIDFRIILINELSQCYGIRGWVSGKMTGDHDPLIPRLTVCYNICLWYHRKVVFFVNVFGRLISASILNYLSSEYWGSVMAQRQCGVVLLVHSDSTRGTFVSSSTRRAPTCQYYKYQKETVHTFNNEQNPYHIQPILFHTVCLELCRSLFFPSYSVQSLSLS